MLVPMNQDPVDRQFAIKPGIHLTGIGEFWPQGLDGHDPAAVNIPRLIYIAHPAAAASLNYLVATNRLCW